MQPLMMMSLSRILCTQSLSQYQCMSRPSTSGTQIRLWGSSTLSSRSYRMCTTVHQLLMSFHQDISCIQFLNTDQSMSRLSTSGMYSQLQLFPQMDKICSTMLQVVIMYMVDMLNTQTIQKLGRMCQPSTSGKKIRLKGSMTLVDMVRQHSTTMHQLLMSIRQDISYI